MTSLATRIKRLETWAWGINGRQMPSHLLTLTDATPSRESSDELSTLAAKYLGMSMEEMDASILEREPSDGDRLEQDLERVLSRTAYADIKRLAASVLSQSGDGE